MSQISKTSTGGGGGGTVNQITPDTGGAVSASNINLFGVTSTLNNDNGIQTANIGSPTIDIRLTNRITGSGTAVGAVTADLVTFSLGATGAVYRFSFFVTGRDTAGSFVGEGLGYTVDASARTDGASASIISTPDIDADEDADLTAALIQVVASANNIILRVTGVAGETITYKTVGTYVVV